MGAGPSDSLPTDKIWLKWLFGFQDQDIKGIMISFSFLTQIPLFWESQLSSHRDTEGALCRGPHGKKLRPPTNRHVSRSSSPSWVFRCLQSQLTFWLQPQKTLYQNHLAKLLPNFWPSETEKINVYCCMLLNSRVICYTAISNIPSLLANNYRNKLPHAWTNQ